MTGAIYWHGTYVFAGEQFSRNPLCSFPKINPAGLSVFPYAGRNFMKNARRRSVGSGVPDSGQGPLKRSLETASNGP